MTLLALPGELAITIANGQVWLSIGLGLLCGAACLAFGTWVARLVGLLDANAPAGETLGVGLASGLMVVAAWWAAIWSGGQSSFTPVAIGFAIAIGLALVTRIRRPKPVATSSVATDLPDRRRSLALTLLGAAVFIVAIALLYGATMAPSPRDGVQPVEYPDAAFYSVLGRDLATTGLESNLSPSGFTDLPGLPRQVWYHWGELWLASAAIATFNVDPLAARHFVVLPVVLLAAGSLTGTLVRRLTGSRSRIAYLFGFLACLFLAPVPFIAGPFFSSWAFGLILGITLYGLGAVSALVGLYTLAILRNRATTWALGAFVGCVVAFMLPAHIVIAVLSVVGIVSIWAVHGLDSVIALRRLPTIAPIWRRTIITGGVVLVATVGWGIFTGHGLGGGGIPARVTPFNVSWSQSVAMTALGGGLLLAIPIAWPLARRRGLLVADLYLGTIAVVVLGAIAWGARLTDFNMFYVFFGGIAAFATPLAAVAAWSLLEHLRQEQRLRLAAAAVALGVIQLGWGAAIGVTKLQQSGPLGAFAPIPVAVLAAIEALPADARLAYACHPFAEATFAEPQLISMDAHTSRRVVPMCFEADVVSDLIGGQRDAEVPNASYAWAPQRFLYPDSAAGPSSAAAAAFLEEHGIGFIFADDAHPNTLVADAALIVESGGTKVYQLP